MIGSLLLLILSLSYSLGQITDAVAVLEPTRENNIVGVVRFSEASDGAVTIAAKVYNLLPNSQHGFHVHVDGDITDPQGMNTGSHFDPFDQPHACPPTSLRHVGDFGNLKADENGTAIYTDVNKLVSLSPVSRASVIGRGIIVHAAVDDCTTQPSGNSGARVSQAVIGICGLNCSARFNIQHPEHWIF